MEVGKELRRWRNEGGEGAKYKKGSWNIKDGMKGREGRRE